MFEYLKNPVVQTVAQRSVWWAVLSQQLNELQRLNTKLHTFNYHLETRRKIYGFSILGVDNYWFVCNEALDISSVQHITNRE